MRIFTFLLIFFSLFVFATDPPHTISPTTYIDCVSCHTPHGSQGSTLTASAGNVNLCQSCHNPSGVASNCSIETIDFAVVGYRGTSHAVDAPVVNPQYGANAPLNTNLSKKIYEGNIICSTCHDQHSSDTTAISTNRAGTQKVSSILHTAGSGTATVSIDSVSSVASQKSYLIEITSGGTTGVAKFKLSNDNGTTWWGFDGSNWVAYTSSPDNSRTTSVTAIYLNDSNNVSVTFSASGSFVVGDRFYFYISYPFLRTSLDDGDNVNGTKLCRDCHRDWTMDYNAVENYDGTLKGHPVGITMNANGRNYDRAIPLDGDGSSNDGISSNNLILDSSQDIQCLTCHSVHYADSNSQTEK